MGTSEGNIAKKGRGDGRREDEIWHKKGTHHFGFTRQKLRCVVGISCNEPLHVTTVPEKKKDERIGLSGKASRACHGERAVRLRLHGPVPIT